MDAITSLAPVSAGPEAAAAPRKFAVLLVPGFSMMSLASAIEPLRACNRLRRGPLYAWQLAGLEDGPVAASNGIALPVAPLREVVADASCLLVCSGISADAIDGRRYFAALRKAAAAGIPLGALSTGTFLLARAGLLSGYRCTIHWESRGAFQEEFPKLTCTGSLYEIDRDRLTCAGGTAALDMMLTLIGADHGEEWARDIANQFHHQHIREGGEVQSGGRREVLAHLPEHLQRAIALMQSCIEDPISLSDLAKRVGLGARQLERLFVRHTGAGPLRYYIRLRVERGRELLIYSEQSLLDVAIACGFRSVASFSTWYQRIYGIRPGDVRAPGTSRA